MHLITISQKISLSIFIFSLNNKLSEKLYYYVILNELNKEKKLRKLKNLLFYKRMNQDNVYFFNSESNILIKSFNFFLQTIFEYIMAIFYLPKMNIVMYFMYFFNIRINLNQI